MSTTFVDDASASCARAALSAADVAARAAAAFRRCSARVLFALDHCIVEPQRRPAHHRRRRRGRSRRRARCSSEARGREPNDEELYALRRVWLDNEVLYREGLALQLDKGDTAIRERVIFKALSVDRRRHEAAAVRRRACCATGSRAIARKYDEPARYDFEEAVLAGDSSESARARLRARAERRHAGRREAGLRVFTGRPHDNLVQSYGAEFATALEASPPGRVAGAAEQRGLARHAPRVDRRRRSRRCSRTCAASCCRTGPTPRMAEQRSAAVRALAKKYTSRSRPRRDEARAARRGCSRCSCCCRERDAAAHEMSMAEMELRETRARRVPVAMDRERQPAAGRRADAVVAATAAAPTRTSCAAAQAGLRGTLAIDGVGERYSAALVKVFWLDGQSRVYTLTPAQPTVQLYGSADDRRGMGEIARAYTRARRRAHPQRLRSPAVRARAAVPGRLQPPAGAARSPRSRSRTA